MKHPLAKMTDIPQTGSFIVPFFGREVHVYLVNGKPRATANVCLHFGGPLEWKDGKFVCPWHGAAFDATTGECVAGPASKASKLLTLSTRVEGDTLYYVRGE